MKRKSAEVAYGAFLRGATAALRRAARRARLDAERTGTCLVVARGKGWVRIPPKHQSGSAKS